MAIHISGIRHHGPGSARNIKAFLEEIKPDIVLVEGPPEADDILQWVSHKELKPPVAILCYQPDNPQQSSFYPFAEFSPEWQAILYARKNNIHVRFMDLPMTHHFAIENEMKKELQKEKPEEKPEEGAAPLNNYSISNNVAVEETVLEIRKDPMSYLAEAAGYEDGEKWWEHMFEHRQHNEEVFQAVNEAMQALRDAFPKKEDRLEQLREAHMRKMIRQAEKEMFQYLLSVSGIGASTARVMLSYMRPDELARAIISGDTRTLEGIKGIGKKTAERMILELRDKLAKHPMDSNILPMKNNTLQQDALNALTALGINRQAAGLAIEKTLAANPNLPIEELIKKALRTL